MTNFQNQLDQHISVMTTLQGIEKEFEAAAMQIVSALKQGNKVLLCGNGGSAADAQHIAAEIVGRFEVNRIGLPAIALTTDTSILTAVANDFGYDRVFSRQVEALAQAGDILIAYSTSGNSEGVVAAIHAAKQRNTIVVGMTGRDGGVMANLVDIELRVESESTARIQEAHAFIGHMLCAEVDNAYADNGDRF